MMWVTNKNKKLPPSSNTTTTSSSNKPSLISHVFPSSWLSKFKQKSGDSEPTLSKVKLKGQRNSPSLRSPRSASRGGGRFYGDDDGEDGFWRLSFGEDSAEVRRSSFGSCQTSATKMEGRGVPQNGGGSLKKELDFKREAVKPEERSTKTEEEVVPELLTVRTILAKEHGLAAGARKHKHPNTSSKKSRSSYLKAIEEELSEEQPSLDWQTLKERKIQEVMAKSEKHRKSVYISRDLQRRPRPKRSSKVRVFSPRTHSRVEICKIKALQDIARAKKAVTKERKVQQVRTGLDSFAVVKCSYDPQQDFRDSMVEMIVEKKITRPDDLEELLACYLTLNSDEYHDLIIKVFRQVWFDLNQACFGSGILQKQQCCND